MAITWQQGNYVDNDNRIILNLKWAKDIYMNLPDYNIFIICLSMGILYFFIFLGVFFLFGSLSITITYEESNKIIKDKTIASHEIYLDKHGSH